MANHELLGGLAPRAFLARYWQRRPRLVRAAVPGFRGPIALDALARLATRDDVESRVVVRTGRRYTLHHGPFTRAWLGRLPQRGWTLLVQGLDHHVPEAAALLDRFRFVPAARLDDVMVSYAAPGGGVGPHFDSYDVFLLQGFGRRRWRMSTQRDLALVPGAPLKLLARFAPTHTWTLGPGDMLYLPPRIAHDGVAIEPCTTYSIGFRSPSAQELGRELLAFRDERFHAPGRYTDAALRPTAHPGALPEALVDYALDAVARVRWSRADARECLGRYLSQPKPHVVFAPPTRPLPRGRFARALAARGLRLDARSIALYSRGRFFLNGERVDTEPRGMRVLERLADARALPPGERWPEPVVALLYDWYVAGFAHLAPPP